MKKFLSGLGKPAKKARPLTAKTFKKNIKHALSLGNKGPEIHGAIILKTLPSGEVR